MKEKTNSTKINSAKCSNSFYINKDTHRRSISFSEWFLTSSIMKNIIAHNEAPGSLRTTSGYVRNTRPGPLLTTSDTCVCCSWAMWPNIEKVTQPARRQVKVLTTQVIIASLQDKPRFLINSRSNATWSTSWLKYNGERKTSATIGKMMLRIAVHTYTSN